MERNWTGFTFFWSCDLKPRSGLLRADKNSRCWCIILVFTNDFTAKLVKKNQDTWFLFCLSQKLTSRSDRQAHIIRQIHTKGKVKRKEEDFSAGGKAWRGFMLLGFVFVGCLTSQQHASVCQGQICSDNFTCCHTKIQVADQTFHLTQSQYTDTGPTSPSTYPITPGAWQGSHWSANVLVTGIIRPRKKSRRKRDLPPSRRTP